MRRCLVLVALCALTLQAQAPGPKLFLAGDWTVRNGNGEGKNGRWGWGDVIGAYFDPAKITVVNRAVGDRSSRTYLTQGDWAKLLEELKPGDFVILQFGHNDSGPINDKARARGTLRGTGDKTQEIENERTGERETVHTFGWYLGKFVVEARAKGATPILCSMVPRKLWVEDKILRNKANYAGWAEQVAKGEGVPFLDLNEILAQKYEALGPDAVAPLFADEHTQSTRAGAELNAECVVVALKRLPKNPLSSYFSDKATPLK